LRNKFAGLSESVGLDGEDCMSISRRRAIALGSTAFVLPSVARAQTWPTGPVTLVVGYAAGGDRDINARCLAQVMPTVTGQPAIVDNRAGAGGAIGEIGLIIPPSR
jgi:tripartite-type tricarboxylate transporter receptor subunit TctC